METAKLNIKQWAEDDRPREKMMQKGASALSNAELLAILIGSGTVEESAVGLMKRVMAACELGRRRMEEDAVELPSIRSSVDLYHYFLSQMQDLFHEECYVLLMNQACRILDKVLVSKGGLTETAVDIRLILREALLRRAPVIALCHNHPSGQVRPSMEDDRLTDRLQKACRMMNIRLLDHIIVAEGGFYSYCEEGKLV